jgi:hypothetical protein
MEEQAAGKQEVGAEKEKGADRWEYQRCMFGRGKPVMQDDTDSDTQGSSVSVALIRYMTNLGSRLRHVIASSSEDR